MDDLFFYATCVTFLFILFVISINSQAKFINKKTNKNIGLPKNSFSEESKIRQEKAKKLNLKFKDDKLFQFNSLMIKLIPLSFLILIVFNLIIL